MSYILIASILFLASCSAQEVVISQGVVQGTVATDGVYFEFHGIPYADSTSGSRRFQAPSPPPSFEELFVANRRDVKCVRALGVGYEGTEDCLVANVYSPTLDATSQLPVVVWIKGREFDRANEPELSFKNFVEQEVVVVTLNFRESILGFLCLGTEIAPGNAGLKDIIAGLRWVQENIAQFGGNPDDVTLIGHGTGAAAVDLITLSPLSEGLVHKAIAQSGSAISPWAVTRDPTEYALLVAEALGHTITNVEQLSEVFTRTSVAALMGVINELELTNNALAFAPCIENEYLEGDEKFMLQSPFQILTSGEFAQIPFVIGFVENEGTIRADKALEDDWLEEMESSFSNFIQSDLHFETTEERETIEGAIRNYYFNDEQITMDNIDDYILYHGDTMILVSALREAGLRAAFSTQTYVYQFSYQGALGEPYAGPFSVVGAGHSEDLGYLFNSVDAEIINSSDAIMRSILVDRWVNFVKNGVPTTESSAVTWLPVTAADTNIIVFRNDETAIEDDPVILELALVNPYPGTFSFWDAIYAEYFEDAEGIWEPNAREDEDEDEVAVVDSFEDGEDEDTTEDPVVEQETETVEFEDNSASTAVGFPFIIISLFSILNHLHSKQLMF